METEVSCPYCGETNAIVIDETGGASQQYVEDCQICCQPWQVTITSGPDGELDVQVQAMAE